MIHSFLSSLRLSNLMLTLALAENITRMRVASPIRDILLRRQLSLNHFSLNLAMMESKTF